jgi:nanoRNase/pAp phosphatase (c-di-AMP/oligoRNAs hydrolase)
VIYDHFGGAERFPSVSDELMVAVDRADSAQYDITEILQPTGWTLLNFLMDSRTGLGRFRQFRISNYQLMMQLIDACIDHQDVEEILALPDVAERAELFRAQRSCSSTSCARVSHARRRGRRRPARRGDHLRRQPVHDLRALPRGARLDPRHLGQAEAQHGVRGRQVDPGPHVADDIGSVMLQYGGGGHVAAGTCQVSHDDAERVLGELIGRVGAPMSSTAGRPG